MVAMVTLMVLVAVVANGWLSSQRIDLSHLQIRIHLTIFGIQLYPIQNRRKLDSLKRSDPISRGILRDPTGPRLSP